MLEREANQILISWEDFSPCSILSARVFGLVLRYLVFNNWPKPHFRLDTSVFTAGKEKVILCQSFQVKTHAINISKPLKSYCRNLADVRSFQCLFQRSAFACKHVLNDWFSVSALRLSVVILQTQSKAKYALFWFFRLIGMFSNENRFFLKHAVAKFFNCAFFERFPLALLISSDIMRRPIVWFKKYDGIDQWN